MELGSPRAALLVLVLMMAWIVDGVSGTTEHRLIFDASQFIPGTEKLQVLLFMLISSLHVTRSNIQHMQRNATQRNATQRNATHATHATHATQRNTQSTHATRTTRTQHAT